jgi:hypothetical protein
MVESGNKKVQSFFMYAEEDKPYENYFNNPTLLNKIKWIISRLKRKWK